MQKTFFVVILILLLALTECTNNSPTDTPLSDTDKIETIVVGTLSAIPSLTPTASPTATFTPASPTPTVANIQTYVDPDFGFKLQYDISWQLEVKPGSGMTYYDGNGRTVWLRKDGYIFQMAVIGGPGDVENCAGTFQQNPTEQYWVYTVDDVEIWRIKAEQGEINGFFDDNLSFIDIISPLELYKEPKIDEYGTDWGSYTCEPQISNHGVRIDYLLPVSLANLQAGNFSQEILAEMDNILISLTWR